MSRLTFDDLTPDDMPEPYIEDTRADDWRDELGDLVKCGRQVNRRKCAHPAGCDLLAAPGDIYCEGCASDPLLDERAE